MPPKISKGAVTPVQVQPANVSQPKAIAEGTTSILPKIIDSSLIDDYFINELLLPHATEMVKCVRSIWQPNEASATSQSTNETPPIINSSAVAKALIQSCLLYIGLYSNGILRTPASLALNLAIYPQNVFENAQPDDNRIGTLSRFYRRYLGWMMYHICLVLTPLMYDISQRWWWNLQENERKRQMGNKHDKNTQKQELGRQRRIKVIGYTFSIIQKVIPMVRLAVLLRCWGSFGKGPPLSPQVAMFLSGLMVTQTCQQNRAPQYTPRQSPQPYVLFEYRRWLQQELSRLGPMLLYPLWESIQETQQTISHFSQRMLLPVWNKRVARPIQKSLSKALKKGEEKRLGDDVKQYCPICKSDPILIPYKPDGCNHIYCYTCLYSHVNSSSDEPECVVCHTVIRSCGPAPTEATSIE